MKITVSGHHVEITEAIKEAAEAKFAKISEHYPDIDTLQVTLTVEKHERKIEAITNYRGVQVSIHATHDDVYVGMGQAVKKMDTALSRRKGQLAANIHEKIAVEVPEDLPKADLTLSEMSRQPL